MRRLLNLIILACACWALPTTASAQEGEKAKKEEEKNFSTDASLYMIAFEPNELFGKWARSKPALTIWRFSPDEIATKYSISLHKGCTWKERQAGVTDCRDTLRARMVRPSPDIALQQPQKGGSELRAKLKELNIKSQEQLIEALDTGLVEWLEADLNTCPAALAMLKKTKELDWVTLNPFPGEELKPYGPSGTNSRRLDLVVTHFYPRNYGVIKYSQKHDPTPVVDVYTPSTWSVDFAEILETCWKPATASPPWRRIEN